MFVIGLLARGRGARPPIRARCRPRARGAQHRRLPFRIPEQFRRK